MVSKWKRTETRHGKEHSSKPRVRAGNRVSPRLKNPDSKPISPYRRLPYPASAPTLGKAALPPGVHSQACELEQKGASLSC